VNGLSAKQRHRINLLKHLGDWENIFPTRTDYLNILGIKRTTLYKHFSPAELQEIENEGLELRKKNTARLRAEVFQSLLAKAKSGNVPAIKEFLNRTEGKVKEIREHTGRNGEPLYGGIQIELVSPKGKTGKQESCGKGGKRTPQQSGFS
jgi:hypothetical protein